MKTYVVLLRGINVSGQKIIKMADLREMLEKLDFAAVQTYIQSGNVILRSPLENGGEIANIVKNGIANTFGFEVPVLVLTHEELRKVFDQNPFAASVEFETSKMYYALLKDQPEKSLVQVFESETYLNEKFEMGVKCVYLFCEKGAGKAKLTNNVIERKLKVSATSRNYRTMMKLLEMSV